MTIWTEPMRDRMKELYAHGDSHSVIAAVLNSEFTGAGLTRNSTISKAHRMGLDMRAGGRHRIRPAKTVTPKKFTMPKAPVMSAAPFVCRDASEIVPLHVELKDLSPEACRWPYGDRLPFSFCGHPKAERWYCAAHQQLSQRPAR